jgi:hypothetical protein
MSLSYLESKFYVKKNSKTNSVKMSKEYTVKRVDEVVPHRHLVTQDQTTQVCREGFLFLPCNN